MLSQDAEWSSGGFLLAFLGSLNQMQCEQVARTAWTSDGFVLAFFGSFIQELRQWSSKFALINIY